MFYIHLKNIKKNEFMETSKVPKLLLIFLMTSSVAFSQAYSNLDLNRDGSVDREEFNKEYFQNYNYWDLNQDGTLEVEEFLNSSYSRLDKNEDHYLDEEEWNRGYDNLYGEYLRTRDYGKFDLDNDDKISNDEFNTGIQITEYYNVFDTNGDGNIDKDELNEGVFNKWDWNQDDALSTIEYNRDKSFYFDYKYSAIPKN